MFSCVESGGTRCGSRWRRASSSSLGRGLHAHPSPRAMPKGAIEDGHPPVGAAIRYPSRPPLVRISFHRKIVLTTHAGTCAPFLPRPSLHSSNPLHCRPIATVTAIGHLHLTSLFIRSTRRDLSSFFNRPRTRLLPALFPPVAFPTSCDSRPSTTRHSASCLEPTLVLECAGAQRPDGSQVDSFHLDLLSSRNTTRYDNTIARLRITTPTYRRVADEREVIASHGRSKQTVRARIVPSVMISVHDIYFEHM